MKNSLKILKVTSALFVIALALAAIGMPDTFGALSMALAFPLVLANYETSDDAKQKRSDIWDEMQKMVDLRKAEKRSFTDDETGKYDQLKKDFDTLSNHIKELEEDEKRAMMMSRNLAKKSNQQKETEKIRKYSFMKVVQAKINERNLDGLEAEMHQEAEKEFRESNIGSSLVGVGIPNIVLRGMTATGQTTNAGDQGGNWVPTVKSGLLEALLPRLVMANLGANFIGGLQGNVDFPKGAAVTGGWKAETADSDEASPLTSVVSMNPNRLPILVKYSRQLMLQSSPDVERFLLNGIFNRIAQAVDQGAINGRGTATYFEPLGILATSGIGSVAIDTNGGALTWAHIIELETKVAAENADIGSLAYLTNAKVRGKLKSTLKASNVQGFIWENGDAPLNGYRAGVTNMVPSNLTKAGGSELSALIFGNFNDLVIGNWGGMDVVVDPYTSKKSGQVEIGANTYWDAKVLRAESFAACVDAVTV